MWLVIAAIGIILLATGVNLRPRVPVSELTLPEEATLLAEAAGTSGLRESLDGTHPAPSTPAEVAKKPARKPSVPVPPAYPVRLIAPSIGLDAPVEAVGVNGAGNIASPSTFGSVGWYQKSALPGKSGSAVFDGHVDNGILRVGAFKRLDELRTGDVVAVRTQGGDLFQYKVSRAETYGYREVPFAGMLAAHERPELVLITCAGNWLSGEKTYDKRLFVFAELVEESLSLSTPVSF